MKSLRQMKILELVAQHSINTQQELAARLAEAGFEATQATVSRDIHELRLQKTPSGSGYRYTVPDNSYVEPDERLHTMFRESVLSVTSAGNIVVVKTLSGLASAAIAAIDSMRLEVVAGTLAGDDTGFVVVSDAPSAEALKLTLTKLMR